MPKQYFRFGNYIVTENKKERTVTIYTKSGKFLSTVDDGELSSECRELDRELED